MTNYGVLFSRGTPQKSKETVFYINQHLSFTFYSNLNKYRAIFDYQLFQCFHSTRLYDLIRPINGVNIDYDQKKP